MNRTALYAVAGIAACIALAAGAYSAVRYSKENEAGRKTAESRQGSPCPHTLDAADCPFCTPSLIESKGFCHGHGVPEALCHLCDPSVIPAFKALGDWCEEHNAPESLCPVCNPNAGLRYMPGAAPDAAAAASALDSGDRQCAHHVAQSQCPYCSPKLWVDSGFCAGHKTPEAVCALCNPSIIPALMAAGDWCEDHSRSAAFCDACGAASRHAVNEERCSHGATPAACPLCAPELIVSKGFCAEHGLPEAICHRCDPAVGPAFRTLGAWCEHEAPKWFCATCAAKHDHSHANTIPNASAALSAGMDALTLMKIPLDPKPGQVACETETMQVRLAPGIGGRIGVETVPIQTRALSETLAFNARVDYNRNQVANLSSRAPGVVAEALKEPGDRVSRGEVAAIIDSVEIGEAKAELLRAHTLADLRQKDHERQQKLLARGAAAEMEWQSAESALAEARIAVSRARQRLRNFGFSEEDIDGALQRGDTGSQWPLSAPFDGIVIERNVAPGEFVSPHTPLFVIADTSVMWAHLDIYESDLGRVREGMPVIFTPDGMPGERFPGHVRWVSAEMSPRTRTLQARVELDNAGGLLRANMFGKAQVAVRDNEAAVIVPKEAVQWEGCCHVVFVRLSDMLYQPRKVRLERELDRHYEVAGVNPGDHVVTAGSFLFKTEILKSSIGAGCCEIAPGA